MKTNAPKFDRSQLVVYLYHNVLMYMLVGHTGFGASLSVSARRPSPEQRVLGRSIFPLLCINTGFAPLFTLAQVIS